MALQGPRRRQLCRLKQRKETNGKKEAGGQSHDLLIYFIIDRLDLQDSGLV